MTPLTIVLCFPVESHHVGQIRRTVPEFTVIPAEQNEIGRTIFQADIFCGHAKQPIDWPAVVAAGRLQWIQSSAAGLDHCLYPAVIDSNIPVTSASGLFANQVAEQTFALLFGLIRSTPAFFQATLERKYERLATDDLHGKTIGIVGLGGNGLRIAEMLAPLGNRILATDYWPRRKPNFIDELWSANRLPDLLAQSDVVVLCVPWNEQTHHLINAETIACMKPGSYLINVARGQVVDEPALVAALRAGKIKAAGLDVAEVEPLPSDSPLWTMPRVMITPHVGAQSHRRVSDTVDFFCQNLLRYVQQQPLKNLVDKRLGFPGMED